MSMGWSGTAVGCAVVLALVAASVSIPAHAQTSPEAPSTGASPPAAPSGSGQPQVRPDAPRGGEQDGGARGNSPACPGNDEPLQLLV